MKDLIAKLEAATGPSFALNAAIARLDWYREQFGDCADDEVPDFCGSIDAAMTLVPENHTTFLCATKAYRDEPQEWVAEVRKLGVSTHIDWPPHPNSIKASPTPALALCIAALKSRDATP